MQDFVRSLGGMGGRPEIQGTLGTPMYGEQFTRKIHATEPPQKIHAKKSRAKFTRRTFRERVSLGKTAL